MNDVSFEKLTYVFSSVPVRYLMIMVGLGSGKKSTKNLSWEYVNANNLTTPIMTESSASEIQASPKIMMAFTTIVICTMATKRQKVLLMVYNNTWAVTKSTLMSYKPMMMNNKEQICTAKSSRTQSRIKKSNTVCMPSGFLLMYFPIKRRNVTDRANCRAFKKLKTTLATTMLI